MQHLRLEEIAAGRSAEDGWCAKPYQLQQLCIEYKAAGEGPTSPSTVRPASPATFANSCPRHLPRPCPSPPSSTHDLNIHLPLAFCPALTSLLANHSPSALFPFPSSSPPHLCLVRPFPLQSAQTYTPSMPTIPIPPSSLSSLFPNLPVPCMHPSPWLPLLHAPRRAAPAPWLPPPAA